MGQGRNLASQEQPGEHDSSSHMGCILALLGVDRFGGSLPEVKRLGGLTSGEPTE